MVSSTKQICLEVVKVWQLSPNIFTMQFDWFLILFVCLFAYLGFFLWVAESVLKLALKKLKL
jgi:hypothetical protein